MSRKFLKINFNEEILDQPHIKIYYEVLNTCIEHIRELESYSWKEDKYEPEDSNDHTINSSQYAWIPFRTKIGNYKGE